MESSLTRSPARKHTYLNHLIPTQYFVLPRRKGPGTPDWEAAASMISLSAGKGPAGGQAVDALALILAANPWPSLTLSLSNVSFLLSFCASEDTSSLVPPQLSAQGPLSLLDTEKQELEAREHFC